MTMPENMDKGFAILWVYSVKPGAEEAFRSAYGSDGNWARLFRKQPGYIRTTLLEPKAEGAPFATIDFWDSEAAFDAFQENFGDAYKTLDEKCDRLTLSETKIGTFHMDTDKE